MTYEDIVLHIVILKFSGGTVELLSQRKRRARYLYVCLEVFELNASIICEDEKWACDEDRFELWMILKT